MLTNLIGVIMDKNGYDKERDKALDSLSTMDKIKYKRLETAYEMAKQSGDTVPPNKQDYILSQIFKKKRQ